MSEYIVYMAINTINGKSYIGYTKNIEKRTIQHLKASKDPKYPFHHAIKKHGEENFVWTILGIFSDKVLATNFEIQSIKNHRTLMSEYGYNIAKGGLGGDTLSNEQKKKFSKITRERNLSKPPSKDPETAKKISENAKKRAKNGTLFKPMKSQETRNKVSKARQGLIHIFNPQTKESKMIHKDEQIPYGFIEGNGRIGQFFICNKETGEHKIINIRDLIPQGFEKGRIESIYKHPSKDKSWYHHPDEKKELLIFSNEVPKGFIKGKLPGMRHIFNKELRINKKISENTPIPKGWELGQIQLHNEYKWISNHQLKESRKIPKEDSLPEKWIVGRHYNNDGSDFTANLTKGYKWYYSDELQQNCSVPPNVTLPNGFQNGRKKNYITVKYKNLEQIFQL